MIQIIVQRKFKGSDNPVFVFSEPRLFAPNISSMFKQYAELLERLPESERRNVFYTMAHHDGAEEASQVDSKISKPQRTAKTFSNQTILAWDIDGSDTSRAMEYAACVAKVIKVPLDNLRIVVTGNGIHVIVTLKTPIRSAKYFQDNRKAYVEICRLAVDAIEKAGLPLDPASKKVDSSIFDAGRVLRLPGTINQKEGKPDKLCTLLQEAEVPNEIDLWALSGLKEREEENISPQEIKRRYPEPDFPHMMSECEFLKWAMASPSEVHEPHAFDVFSLLAPQQGSFNNQTPMQVAENLFKQASNSPSLKSSDFMAKWDQAKLYGGRKCPTIDDHWGKCATCKHYGKIPTPLALKSKDHIGSQSLGYWVLNQDGGYKHPAYEDLVKVFRKENHYVVSEGRVFIYSDGIYREIQDLEVKAWLENTLTPTEPLREVHRVEFLHKVKNIGFISEEKEKRLFEESIQGKLNCANHAIDILTGAKIDHSPKHGFKSKLDYSIDLSDPGPEKFLDWLEKILDYNSELMESVLDMMAYCLWPSYDDHLFMYLTGSGANGKSTLMHVIREMVGKENYSSIGLHQLCSNRFAPAQLEGRLINLSEESSGGGQELDHEALNTLKTLSAGGDIFVERKGKDGYSITNQAKLMFSANTPPRFKESGHAIQRRLLVIPFNHKIEDPDSRIEDELIKEVPSLVAMLVRRIQENVKKNGRFIVSRGGVASEREKQRFLLNGNSACNWAAECLDIAIHLGDKAYISATDAYMNYQEWCEASGYKNPMNKNTFGVTMKEHITKRESVTKKIGGKAVRIYQYCRFKEEGESNGIKEVAL